MQSRESIGLLGVKFDNLCYYIARLLIKYVIHNSLRLDAIWFLLLYIVQCRVWFIMYYKYFIVDYVALIYIAYLKCVVVILFGVICCI